MALCSHAFSFPFLPIHQSHEEIIPFACQPNQTNRPDQMLLFGQPPNTEGEAHMNLEWVTHKCLLNRPALVGQLLLIQAGHLAKARGPPFVLSISTPNQQALKPSALWEEESLCGGTMAKRGTALSGLPLWNTLQCGRDRIWMQA